MLIAIQANELNSLNILTDSTLAIAKELQNSGHSLFFYTPDTLSLSNNEAIARGSFIEITNDASDWYKVLRSGTFNLKDADVVLVRQDPPYNMHYITSTFILDTLDPKVKVLNSPTSLRNNSEKFITCHFPQYILPTLYSRDKYACEDFFKEYKSVIFKPIYEFAGRGVILVETKEQFNKAFEAYFKSGEYFILQQYVPSVVTEGDKRVLFLNGKLLTAFGKVPPKGKITANLAAGGTPVACELTTQEKKMCTDIGRKLKELDIFFAGADILGGHLLEINITSPTGIMAANKLYGKNFGAVVAREITLL